MKILVTLTLLRITHYCRKDTAIPSEDCQGSVTAKFWHCVMPSGHYFVLKRDVKRQKSKICPTFEREPVI